jgi:NADH-quinone oxidoreductase subunit E
MADFTPEQQRRYDEGVAEILRRYPEDQKGAGLLPTLHLVQDILGWVPTWAMRQVAASLEVPLVRVREVATFYSMYHLEKPGEHLIEVCTNPACQILGGEEVLRRVCERYGVQPGETSADGKVTVQVVECMGSCGTAPMLALDREYRENLTRERLEAIFAEIEGTAS